METPALLGQGLGGLGQACRSREAQILRQKAVRCLLAPALPCETAKAPCVVEAALALQSSCQVYVGTLAVRGPTGGTDLAEGFECSDMLWLTVSSHAQARPSYSSTCVICMWPGVWQIGSGGPCQLPCFACRS